MRKWMRDRMQRRKKKEPVKNEVAAPPPLQPAYFEAEQLAENPPESPGREEVSQVDEAAPITSSAEPSTTPTPVDQDLQTPRSDARSGSEPGRARGSRRRRGGRGRSGRGREQAVARAFAPAAVKEVAGAEAVFGEPAAKAEGEAAPSPASPPILKPAPSSTPRPPKGLVVLAIGLPGSGKSTWFKRHNIAPLSSDMMRSLLFDDVREQRFQDLVFSNLRSMLKGRLIAKRPTNYVDATNLTPNERQHWIKLAKDYGYEVHAVFFDVPLEVCIERHQRRDRVVPEDVMRRMAAKLKPPSFEEGFAKITVVRVKKKEEAG
jgi:predicted kinase